MKQKLANLLRRWASKLSPDNTDRDRVLTDAMISRTTADVKIFRIAHHYSRRELQEMEQDPDLAAVIDMNRRRELLKEMGLALYQGGALTFHTEPEGCPDSHDVLIATCRAVVVKK